MLSSFMCQQRPVLALALKTKPWGISGHPSVTGARLLNLSCGWQVPLSCPSGQRGCRAQKRAIFCCAESRWWHGAADGYGKASGLKLGLTCMKQKVFTTHELPEKEPDVTVCLTEVENYCEASIEINPWEVKAALWKVAVAQRMLLAAQSQWRYQPGSAAWISAHQTARRQFAQARNTSLGLERTNQTEQTDRKKAADGWHSG